MVAGAAKAMPEIVLLNATDVMENSRDSSVPFTENTYKTGVCAFGVIEISACTSVRQGGVFLTALTICRYDLLSYREVFYATNNSCGLSRRFLS